MSIEFIGFHITDRCQLDCDHCLRDPGKKPLDLSVEVIGKVMDQAKALYGIDHVGFTGGEPTLHPDFLAVVDAAVSRGMKWHMVTNARRFVRVMSDLEKVPARLQALSHFNFSLDGATEATHDGIRGEGSFRDVMRAAAYCKMRGIKFVFGMAVHARNQHEIEQYAMLAAKLGADSATFGMLQTTGTIHDDHLFMPAADWRAIADRVDRLAELLTIPLGRPEGFFEDRAFYMCAPFRFQQLHVNVEGKLNLCCQHSGTPAEGQRSDVVADLAVDSLAEGTKRLVTLMADQQRRRIDDVAAGNLEEWDMAPCNYCMKSFGKPHWTANGAAGPGATRERWRGAWAEDKQLDKNLGPARRLPVIG